MTMNYCGKCGSANGSTARFCRQCGTELNGQTAFSSQTAPLNVEFSTKAGTKEREKDPAPDPPESASTRVDVAAEPRAPKVETPRRPTPPPPPPPPVPKPRPHVEQNQASQNHRETSLPEKDVKAISDALRNLRKAAQKKDGEQKPQKPAGPVGRPVAPGTPPPPRPAARVEPPQKIAPPSVVSSRPDHQDPSQRKVAPDRAEQVHRVREGAGQQGPGKNPGKNEESGRPSGKQPPNRSANAKPSSMTGLQSRPQAMAPNSSGAQASPSVSVIRKNSESLSAYSSGSLSLALGNRSSAGASGGQLQHALQGPASVLVQASGLKPQSFGSKFLAGVIILAILISMGTYFIVRDYLLAARPFSETDKELLRAEDQSAEFIKAGEDNRSQGKIDAAIEQFQRALTLTPNSQQAIYSLGLTYSAAKQDEEALKAYQSLLRIAPEHLDGRMRIAEIYRVRGNLTGAYQELQRVIAYDQNSVQAREALRALEKIRLESASQLAAADAARNANDLKRRKMKTPVLPTSLIESVGPPIVILRQPPTSAMRPPSQVAALEDPGPQELADTHKKLGVRYLTIREYRAAINEFLTALRISPNDKDLYYFIASSYNGLNQPALAYDYYRRVDAGPYVGPAKSGARLTEKAAREENKRREQLKNEVGKDTGAVLPSKSFSNSVDE
jgi:tetratricopeptide (TPR) repeat protein